MRSAQQAAYAWNVTRTEAWASTMREAKWGHRSTKERYEDLRERYANGSIDLEDFTAEVVTLLREGL